MSARTHPGDELVAEPQLETTQSRDIAASPEAVWPWLVQMGYHRAGWYIDTWWDAVAITYVWPLLVPPDARPEYRPPADEIIPSLQRLAVGDTIPDGPPGSAFYEVKRLDPCRALVLESRSHFRFVLPERLQRTRFGATGVFSWAFILDPIAPGRTRLTIRTRISMTPALLAKLVRRPMKIIDHFHVRAMLRGIAKRAEAMPRPSARRRSGMASVARVPT